MLVHIGKKDFNCEVCGEKFTLKGNLKQHMLTHTKVKAHECDICKKKFTYKSHLVEHFRVHLGEKPFVCAKCGKWFTQAAGRYKNIKTHHKELRKEQQSELTCKLQKTIVNDYLKSISEYNSK